MTKATILTLEVVIIASLVIKPVRLVVVAPAINALIVRKIQMPKVVEFVLVRKVITWMHLVLVNSVNLFAKDVLVDVLSIAMYARTTLTFQMELAFAIMVIGWTQMIGLVRNANLHVLLVLVLMTTTVPLVLPMPILPKVEEMFAIVKLTTISLQAGYAINATILATIAMEVTM